jgi:hypothetical protein
MMEMKELISSKRDGDGVCVCGGGGVWFHNSVLHLPSSDYCSW